MKTTKQSIFFHQRSVTDVRFHPDGDLLFASSKDATACATNLQGKLLGSFEKHEGSITTLDIQKNILATGSTDMSMILWDILTGKATDTVCADAVVRGIDYTDELFFCTDNTMNRECFIARYDSREGKPDKVYHPGSSITKLFKFRDLVIYSDDSGMVFQVDLKTHKVLKEKKIHSERITSLRPSPCRSFFVTGSKDTTVKIVDTLSLEEKKLFECEEPVNSACIFPTNDKLVTVGGIDARDVTTTKGKGVFDANFFDVVTQQKIGTYSAHFGTINAVDIHPAGTHYATGGEDGSICLALFGTDFYTAPFTSFDIV